MSIPHAFCCAEGVEENSRWFEGKRTPPEKTCPRIDAAHRRCVLAILVCWRGVINHRGEGVVVAILRIMQMPR
ncbi:hypothetical protein CA85_07110 [Allorhodopirellula solitaria]|uniref:Uncharacterized protein n=1 Tax=Allorhodopirellula solitaria TaxID=2527987 RepID=A0A5C5YKI3_9BACT|nr:hypothetical protein CA85_07110 [Allorhodopirellula solitaria]